MMIGVHAFCVFPRWSNPSISWFRLLDLNTFSTFSRSRPRNDRSWPWLLVTHFKVLSCDFSQSRPHLWGWTTFSRGSWFHHFVLNQWMNTDFERELQLLAFFSCLLLWGFIERRSTFGLHPEDDVIIEDLLNIKLWVDFELLANKILKKRWFLLLIKDQYFS